MGLGCDLIFPSNWLSMVHSHCQINDLSFFFFFLLPLSDINDMAMKLISAYEEFKVKGPDEEFAFIPPQVSEPVYSCPICSNKDQRVSFFFLCVCVCMYDMSF